MGFSKCVEQYIFENHIALKPDIVAPRCCEVLVALFANHLTEGGVLIFIVAIIVECAKP